MTETKSIMVIGARGRAGSAAVAEALARGHEVTAVVRDPSAFDAPAGVTVRAGDVTDPVSVSGLLHGHDAVIAGVYDAARDPALFMPAAARALADVVEGSRLVWVSLAAVLPNSAGTPLMDTADYPQEYRSFYLAHLAALDTLRASDLDWVAVSPSGDFDHGGDAFGGYQLAPGDAAARITYADHAIALVDEAVAPSQHRTHVGVARASVTA